MAVVPSFNWSPATMRRNVWMWLVISWSSVRLPSDSMRCAVLCEKSSVSVGVGRNLAARAMRHDVGSFQSIDWSRKASSDGRDDRDRTAPISTPTTVATDGGRSAALPGQGPSAPSVHDRYAAGRARLDVCRAPGRWCRSRPMAGDDAGFRWGRASSTRRAWPSLTGGPDDLIDCRDSRTTTAMFAGWLGLPVACQLSAYCL